MSDDYPIVTFRCTYGIVLFTGEFYTPWVQMSEWRSHRAGLASYFTEELAIRRLMFDFLDWMEL